MVGENPGMAYLKSFIACLEMAQNSDKTEAEILKALYQAVEIEEKKNNKNE